MVTQISVRKLNDERPAGQIQTPLRIQGKATRKKPQIK